MCHENSEFNVLLFTSTLGPPHCTIVLAFHLKGQFLIRVDQKHIKKAHLIMSSFKIGYGI